MKITETITNLIETDLINNIKPKTKEDVYKYRDEHFLNGAYDYLFLKFIKTYRLNENKI